MRELDTIALRWQEALDAGTRAVDANTGRLPPAELNEHRKALGDERRQVAAGLSQLARALGIASPWVPARRVTPHMLGLDPGTRACIFDLEGVLTDSGALHAAAWAETLDPLLLAVAHRTGRTLPPFDPRSDYDLCFDGRTRLDGIRLFLEGRGLHLPETEVQEVARRKGEVLAGRLAHRGVAALAEARRFLQAAGYAELERAVVSASMTAVPMLEAAQLAHLVDAHVDAATIHAEHLRARPAPDLLLAACGELGVEPAEAVSLTHSGAGIVACAAIGMPAIGVATGKDGERLRDYGAERVVPSLSRLLAPELRRAA